ncbi:MAG: hypothetical protein HXY25_02375 [Alphaproteobacteria bacterium]|nr:hypothetical protein [Alphaproteobacteria bacterium]
MVLDRLFGGGRRIELPSTLSESFFNRYFAGLTRGVSRPDARTWRTVLDLVDRLETGSDLKVWFMGFLERTGRKVPSAEEWAEVVREVDRVQVDERTIPKAWKETLAETRNVRIDVAGAGKTFTDVANRKKGDS